jgi:SdrD B-like domain
MKNVLKKNKSHHLLLLANSTLAKIVLYLLFTLLSLEIVFAQEQTVAYNSITTSSKAFTPLGSIGSIIWKDKNKDGVKNINEYGIAGVVVELYQFDANNKIEEAPIAATVSNAFGKYSFTDLPVGNYKVKVVLTSLPKNHQLSPKVIRSKISDFVASFDPTNGFSEIISIDSKKKDILTLGMGVALVECTPLCVPISAQIIR